MRFGLCIAAATVALALLGQPRTEQKVLSAGEEEGEMRKSPFDSDFEGFAKAALDRWKVPGVSVAVVDGEDTWAEVCDVCFVLFWSCWV